MKSRPEKGNAPELLPSEASIVKNQDKDQGSNVTDSKALTIASTSVRQMNGLYSLNDLHKAAGGAAKHKPSEWLRSQQTKDLVQEISKAGITALEVKKGGRTPGTYACKELVTAYAAWISAAFHLNVLRVFLAVSVPQPAPYSVRPGQTLSEEQAATLRNLLTDGVKKLPKAVQGNATVVGWSKLKAHFKTGYRQIPAAEFHEAVSILARHVAEWQLPSFEPDRQLQDLERANKGLQRMVEQLYSALGQALSAGSSWQSATSQPFQTEREG